MRLLSIFLLFASFLLGIELKEIQSKVQENIDKSVQILQNQAFSQKEKSEQIIVLFNPLFDYDLMARLSLGNANFQALDQKDKERYIQAFSNMLKNTYASRINSYTDQKIIIDSLTQPKPKRAMLKIYIDNDGQRYEVIYKFHEKSPQDWLIYDFDLVGISTIKTYQGQFKDILDTKGIQELIAKLNAQQ